MSNHGKFHFLKYYKNYGKYFINTIFAVYFGLEEPYLFN